MCISIVFANFLDFSLFYQVHPNFYLVCQKLAEVQANSKGLTVDKLDKNWNEPDKTRKNKENLRKIAKTMEMHANHYNNHVTGQAIFPRLNPE